MTSWGAGTDSQLVSSDKRAAPDTEKAEMRRVQRNRSSRDHE